MRGIRWTRPVPLLATLAAALIVFAGASRAEAFFWPPWPGSEGSIDTGKGNPNDVGEKPTPQLPEVVIPKEEKPPVVPEPASVITGLVGLSLALGYRWRKRRSAGDLKEATI